MAKKNVIGDDRSQGLMEKRLGERNEAIFKARESQRLREVNLMYLIVTDPDNHGSYAKPIAQVPRNAIFQSEWEARQWIG